MLSFNVSEVYPGIFHLKFEDKIELISHFWRYQEFYECPEHSGKNFQLIDYIKWYMRKHDSLEFTYFNDWEGFNIPASSVTSCYPQITDRNDHDELLYALAKGFLKQHERAYIIGTTEGSHESTLQHEIAHGFYYICPVYRGKVNTLVSELLSTKEWDAFCKALAKIGYSYAGDIMTDELNAFLSTGLIAELEGIISKEKQKKFVDLFEDYNS